MSIQRKSGPSPSARGGCAPVRVLIADRNAHYRETLRRVLSHHAHCNIMGEAATLTEAVRLARRTDPDIALLDFDLVVNQSAARLRRLADAFPRLHVIVLLSEYSDDYREAVRKRWGYTCIAKEQAETQLDELVAESWPAAG